MSEKRIHKSNDKKICGVCGGIAEYFGVDPTIVRLIFVLAVMFTGVGILPYIIAAIIMDECPEGAAEKTTYKEENSYSANNNYYETDEPVGFKFPMS
ncbi:MULTISPECIES: PspC domain-containing protein [unclassified Butyrivibrio]|uniref:PspC domain-containing protein n=1 Tax=unclassified Butyrivibrio TaxID=2639466 RepID=UPI0003B31C7F|nr:MULTISPECIES: PspC domain-containing protein [unclassified Butyrivibrio]SEM12776.1 phage shock protein C (PspC) family protein [Butyrivibrio sp. ob235]